MPEATERELQHKIGGQEPQHELTQSCRKARIPGREGKLPEKSLLLRSTVSRWGDSHKRSAGTQWQHRQSCKALSYCTPVGHEYLCKATKQGQEAAYRDSQAQHCLTGDHVHPDRLADIERAALAVAVPHLAPGR